jgi:hypothetical protein
MYRYSYGCVVCAIVAAFASSSTAASSYQGEVIAISTTILPGMWELVAVMHLALLVIRSQRLAPVAAIVTVIASLLALVAGAAGAAMAGIDVPPGPSFALPSWAFPVYAVAAGGAALLAVLLFIHTDRRDINKR